jgi:hypothetical protein
MTGAEAARQRQCPVPDSPGQDIGIFIFIRGYSDLRVPKVRNITLAYGRVHDKLFNPSCYHLLATRANLDSYWRADR